MKCICPSGGDRTCPDDCIIAVWHTLPDNQKTPERRRPLIEILSRQGYTQASVALQLGVSTMTISRDIETFNTVLNVKGQGKDTRGRRRSTGRPKRRKPEPGVKQAQRSVNTTPEEWNQFKKQAIEEGYDSAAAKLGKLIAEPEIARADLSMTAQQKFDAALRQYKLKLDTTFRDTVNKRVRELLEETILPRHRAEQDEARRVMDKRKGIMDKATFKLIWSALHPDSRNSITDKKLAQAFDAFSKMEKLLLNEKDSPTDFAPLPRTMAEWDKAKAAATAARRAKRANASALRPR